MPFLPQPRPAINATTWPQPLPHRCRGRFHIGPVAAAQGPADGQDRSLQTGRGPQPTGKPQSCGIANPCRGRCLHRPATPPRHKRRRMAATLPHRRRGRFNIGPLCAAANTPGGYGIRPYRGFLWRERVAFPACKTHKTSVGRDALIPPRTPPRREGCRLAANLHAPASHGNRRAPRCLLAVSPGKSPDKTTAGPALMGGTPAVA